jgi:uncharacterized protein (TIGR03382 family)
MYTRALLCGFAVVLAVETSARADGLNLHLSAFPDVTSVQTDVRYVSSTHVLQATGYATAFENDGLGSTAPLMISGGTMTLTASVSGAGAATTGNLVIMGAIPSLSLSNQILLSGTLQSFSAVNNGGTGTLEFTWTGLSGALAPNFLAKGALAGTILTNIQNFTSFAADFDNLSAHTQGTGAAIGDTASVPAPAAGALLGLGGLMLGRRRR